MDFEIGIGDIEDIEVGAGVGEKVNELVLEIVEVGVVLVLVVVVVAAAYLVGVELLGFSRAFLVGARPLSPLSRTQHTRSPSEPKDSSFCLALLDSSIPTPAALSSGKRRFPLLGPLVRMMGEEVMNAVLFVW